MNKAKVKGQFRLRVTGILEVFRQYGLDIYIPGAVEGICQEFDRVIEEILEKEKGERH